MDEKFLKPYLGCSWLDFKVKIQLIQIINFILI